jgi:hypothetical protein
MQRWTVTDRQGREIYLTQERWEHILSKHAELHGRLEDVLSTIRAFRYRPSPENNAVVSNNFVTTAWGDVSTA